MTRIVNGYEIKPGADLDYANLSRADLSGANLSLASLIRAILAKANLSVANLGKAKLYGVYCMGADFRFANLVEADFSLVSVKQGNIVTVWNADLSGANLSGANFSFSDLNGANLMFSDLIQTNFIGAKFGPNGPDPRNFVGCVGLESAIFDDGVKEALMAKLEALKAEMEQ